MLSGRDAAGLICLVLLSLAGQPLHGAPQNDDSISVVSNAIAATDTIKLNRWAYTLTTQVDGTRTVEKYDPSQTTDRRWQLVIKEGKTPAAKDLAKYAEERRKRGGRSNTKNIRSLIDPSKILILSNDAARIYCRIELKKQDAGEGVEIPSISGTLTVLREPPQVERWDVASTAKFGKAGVFSISEMRFGMSFQQAPERAGVLPRSVSSRIRGRALIFKSLNVDSLATYSDFVWKGKPASDTNATVIESPPAGD